ncbi:MAG: type II toxin-antitoxin system VapC family toxin [Desulfobacterales bacterium]|nr:type II toxin-antitoxin system VapC family toxin [Desulfobacterales bacterium]
MKCLLDTHTFIWWDSDRQKLSKTVSDICRDQSNTLMLSVASVWEMQIKHQLGKLTLKLPLATIIQEQRETNMIEVVPIQLVHVLALESLPLHHRDPFDRLVIAQANVEGAIVLSCDPIFIRYPVNVTW